MFSDDMIANKWPLENRKMLFGIRPYLIQTQVLYSGFSSHLILKEEFPAILWQKLQHAVFVCGSCHS
jgi:ABC-type arginine/histidine transport system permease subunit